MTRIELLYSLTENPCRKEKTLPEQALAYASITPDMPCYAGALQNVEHALQGGQPLSWWLDYQAYLEAHTDTYEGIDQQCICNAIQVVKAIVYAMTYKYE